MTVSIRPYQSSTDYEAVVKLYSQSGLYGGQFDENRDAPERLISQTANFPEAILVAINDEQIVGTISLVDDGRVAWLFRFAVVQNIDEVEATRRLYEEATKILAERGHSQVLVYAPTDDDRLAGRYDDLGMNRGGNYTCYWSDIGQ